MSDVVEAYYKADAENKQVVHYGQLKENMFRHETDQQKLKELRNQLTDKFLEYRTLPYDYGFCAVNMCATIVYTCRLFRWCTTCGGDTEAAVICSELVAMIYRDFGILPADTKTENVSPMDFLGYERDEKGIPEGIIEQPTKLITVEP